MNYVDIPFPPRISLGAQRRPGWSTTVVATIAGFESTNQNWSRARHAYEVSLAVRTEDDYDTVVQHFHQVRGRAKAFPFKDALDYRVEASRGVLLDDGDSPTTGYHLAKRYGSGADAYDRRITRPKSGTVAIYRLRGGVTTDITGSATISYTTGWVTFTGGTVHAGDVLSWAGQFWVPCRYDVDQLPGLIVDRRGSGGPLLVQCESIPILEVRE
jgi:uncharacterized protein (TIGR02217 family)